jgi:hypothetical protein
VDKIHNFLHTYPADLLLDGSARRIDKERCGRRIVSFPQWTSSIMVLHAHVSSRG